MKSISRQNNFLKSKSNKKGLSEIISYVLLISITIALSVLVYNWLRFYVSGEEVPECSEGVNLIIKEFKCYSGKNLTITLQNKGRFSVDGFTIRVHNRTDADFGFYTLNDTGVLVEPANETTTFSDLTGFGNLTYLEVQPFVIDEENGGEKISCKSDTSQEVVCV